MPGPDNKNIVGNSVLPMTEIQAKDLVGNYPRLPETMEQRNGRLVEEMRKSLVYTPGLSDSYSGRSLYPYANQSTDINEEYSGLLNIHDPNMPRNMAEQQPWGEQFRRALGVGIMNIAPEILGGAGDLVEYVNKVGTEGEAYGNDLRKWAESVKQENIEDYPILRENPGKSMDLGDSAYWFEKGRDIVTSAGAFLVEGYITGGIASKLLSSTLRGKKWLQVALKTGNTKTASRFSNFFTPLEAGIVGKGASLATNYTLNTIEGMQTATSIFDEVYKQLLPEMGEEAARKKASEAAAHSILVNRANMVVNMTSSGMFVKSPLSSRSLTKPVNFKNTLKSLGSEAAQEYVEETWNVVSEQAGLAKGYDEEYGLSNVFDTVFSQEGFEAGLWGAIGGVLQTGGGIALGHIPTPKNKETGKLQSKYSAQKETYQKQMELLDSNDPYFAFIAKDLPTLEKAFSDKAILPKLESTIRSVKALEKIYPEFKEAVEKKDIKKVEEIQTSILASQALLHFENGTTEKLLEYYDETVNGIINDSVITNKDEESSLKKKAQQAKDYVTTLEKVYNEHRGNPDFIEIYNNRAKKIYTDDKIKDLQNKNNNNITEVSSIIQNYLDTELASLEYYNSSETEKEYLSYDINNLLDSKDARTLSKKGKEVYDNFLNTIATEPVIRDFLNNQYRLNNLNNLNKDLQKEFMSFTDPKEFQKRQDKLKTKRKELFNVFKEIANDFTGEDDIEKFKTLVSGLDLSKDQKDEIITSAEKRKKLFEEEEINQEKAAQKVNKSNEVQEEKTDIVDSDPKIKSDYTDGEKYDNEPAKDFTSISDPNEETIPDKRKKGFAWVDDSDSDTYTGRELNNQENGLQAWIGDTNINKIGVKLMFVWDKDRPADIEKIISGTPSERREAIKYAPIKIIVLNEDGSPKYKVVNGKTLPIFSYVLNDDGNSDPNYDMREKIVNALIQGNEVTSETTGIGNGKLKFTEKYNPLLNFSNIKLGVSNGKDTVFNIEEIDSKNERDNSKKARVYMIADEYKLPNGDNAKIMLGTNKLGPEKAKIVLNLIGFLRKYGVNDEKFSKDNPLKSLGIEGLTIGQLFDLLVYKTSSHKLDGSHHPLGIVTKKGKIEVSGIFNGKAQVFTLEDIIKDNIKKNQVLNYIASLPSFTNIHFVNKTLKDIGVTNNIIFMGKSYENSSNYNDLLLNSGSVFTNIKKLVYGNYRANPWVDFDENVVTKEKAKQKKDSTENTDLDVSQTNNLKEELKNALKGPKNMDIFMDYMITEEEQIDELSEEIMSEIKQKICE